MEIDLKDLRDDVNRTLGFEALTTLEATGKVLREGLHSGSMLLNLALSGNPFVGYAWGRIAEIYGPEQGGKTTLALHAVLEAQRMGLPAVYIDAEHALDPLYMKALGIDTRKLSIDQPDDGEQALTVAQKCIEGGYRLIVVDSVAALVPKAELEGDIGDAHMGKAARMMGQAMRILTGRVSKMNAVLIFINQVRMKLGVVFGNPETTTGGFALKFFASYRIEIRAPRGGAEKEKSLDGDTTETGIEAKLKVVKNKLYPPYRTATVQIKYGRGIDKFVDATAVAEKLELFGATGRITVAHHTYTAKQLPKALATDKAARVELIKLIKEAAAKPPKEE